MKDAIDYLEGYQLGKKVGYEQRKKEVKMATVSLAEYFFKHRQFGRQDVVGWIKEHEFNYTDSNGFARVR